MKIRAGFVSNSSTASFIIQMRPTEWDNLFHPDDEDYMAKVTLPKEKIGLLKKCGFYETKEDNPLRKELGTQAVDKKVIDKDGEYLTFWISCNHDYVLQFLVANEIPFKAAVHYGHYTYSYDPKDKCVYRLQNFGLEYMKNYKDLEKAMNKEDDDFDYIDLEPMRVIPVDEILKDYNEKDSKDMMGEPLTRE